MEMLTPEIIEKIKQFKNLHREIKKELGAVAVRDDGVEGDVFLNMDSFMNEFKHFEVQDREMSDYPYRLAATIEGITFFAICNAEETEKAGICTRREVQSWAQSQPTCPSSSSY
jgi:hypothetical protein